MNTILYLYLKSFSAEGGIEKFNRAMMKALSQVSIDSSFSFKAISLYDISINEKYVCLENFSGFNGNKLRFTLNSLLKSRQSDLVIISHINLYVIGLIIKLIFTKTKVILVVHGIEIWHTLNLFKKLFLKKVDIILSVSEFTKKQLILNSDVNPDKIIYFPNTIDSLSDFKPKYSKNENLIDKFEINDQTKVLLTVCRLSAAEQYKGYDRVIQSMPIVMEHFPDLIYIIVGGGDEVELERIANLTDRLNLNSRVKLAGYVPSEVLCDYYNLADIFIMPSKGEGFGIVFLEALASGIPVIAGDKDGSVEPLMHGKLGLLVDPDDCGALSDAILRILTKQIHQDLLNPENLSQQVFDNFGYNKFKSNLESVINQIG